MIHNVADGIAVKVHPLAGKTLNFEVEIIEKNQGV